MLNRYVKYSTEEQLGKITLTRPKNNALDLDTLQELIACFRESAENQDICVILAAEGKNFTVGADLKYIYATLVENKNFAEMVAFSECFQELTRAMFDHPGIIIVGLHGWVVGGGFELTLACDMRIASSDTQAMLPELSIGTMFSNASTKLLAQTIGMGRAKQLMFLGEPIDAQTMLHYGLVSQICDREALDETLLQIATSIIAKNDRAASTMAKRLINENIDSDVESVLLKEMEALTVCAQNDSFLQKVTEFATQKRG
ncbi:MAG: enoyl-CoA hydratase/isomerase family protein [Candidatus Hodarchaeales archaeon]|jgi:enoyl-CoA hydratase